MFCTLSLIPMFAFIFDLWIPFLSTYVPFVWSRSRKGLIRNHLQIEIEFSSIHLIIYCLHLKREKIALFMCADIDVTVSYNHIMYDICGSQTSIKVWARYIRCDNVVVSIHCEWHRRTWNKTTSNRYGNTAFDLMGGTIFFIACLQNDSDYIRNYMHLHKLIRSHFFFYMWAISSSVKVKCRSFDSSNERSQCWYSTTEILNKPLSAI